MAERKRPKVLVVSINGWRDNTGINTLISFFEDWDIDAIAQIYTRDVLPNTRVCNKFFRISEKKLIKSIFKRNVHSGTVVQNTPDIAGVDANSLYNLKHNHLMSFAREIVWMIGNWRTKELKCFLDEYEPDVLFFPTYASTYMNRLQLFIAEYTKKPIVLYASDDNYSYLSVNKDPLSLLMRMMTRKHQLKLFKRASKVLVISPKQKEEYDKQFNISCDVMTKGIDYSTVKYLEPLLHDPIRIVYTGKLIIGRWKSLASIASAVRAINKVEVKAVFDIYSPDVLTEKQLRLLNQKGSVTHDAVSLEESRKIQEEADILVFVESLDKKYRYKARLSFSTKLTDYFKSSKCIFAVGDKDIAPIDYLQKNDAAIIATSYDQVYDKLNSLIDSKEMIVRYSKKAYECGLKNHDVFKRREILNKALWDVTYAKQ